MSTWSIVSTNVAVCLHSVWSSSAPVHMLIMNANASVVSDWDCFVPFVMAFGGSMNLIFAHMVSDWDYFVPFEMDFEVLYRMYEVATKELGQETIIIDSDDLLQNPGRNNHHRL